MVMVSMGADILEDPAPFIPSTIRRDRNMKGTYLFLRKYDLGEIPWEDIVREFAKEELKVELTGRGSVKISCTYAQGNWLRFCSWINSKYTRIYA
jgi:hypothetical protein